MAAVALALLAAAPARALDPGDSNRDRRVSAADVPALLRILAGQPANDGADANRDGFVLGDDLAATFARIFEGPLAEPTTTPAASVTTTATATATAAASTPTRTPTMPESTPTRTSTPTASPSSAPSHTATATGSASPAPSFTPSLTATATSVPSPSSTPAVSPTPTRSAAPTSTSSATPITPSTPTNTPTATATDVVATNTPTVTQTQPPPATVTRTATQVATQTPPPSPTPSASATRTVTVGPIAVTRCSNTLPTPLAIPDGNLQGVSNTFTVPDNVSIADLDVAVEIDHPFIGDLRITLTHVTTNTTVVLVDRPAAGDCGGDNISCTFDDNAARFASFVCSQHDPALGGGIIPDGFLGDLAGQSLAGTWRLTVADEAARDVGTLVSWCLRANSTVPVVTRITCNDEPECTVGLGEPYVLAFDFRDRDGNANGYRVTARDDRGNLFPLNDDPIVPAMGEGTISLNFNDGFSCDAPPCVTTEFEFFVTVRDAGGQESPFASLLITSLGTQ